VRPARERPAKERAPGKGGSRLHRGVVTAALVGGLALLVQLAFLWDSRDEPTFWHPIVDAAVYHENALAIANGGYSIDTPYYHPPLFPYVLALIYRVSGNSMLAAKLVLALFGAMTVVLTALVARRVIGPRAGLAAGIATALCGPLVFYNAQLLPAGLETMLTMLFWWLVLCAGATGAAGLWLAAGVAGGLAADTIPNALVVVPFVLGWLLWKERAHPLGRRAWGPALMLVLGLAIAILPVTVANYVHSRQWCLISYNGGLNLYIGNNLDSERTTAIRPGFEWEDLEHLPARSGVLRETDGDRYFVAKTANYVFTHPGHFLRGLLHKARQFTNARELPRNVDLYVFRAWSPLLAALVWQVGPFGFPFGVLFPLACLGLLVAARQRPGAMLLGEFAVAYAASVALIFVASRYRVVLLPLLIVFAVHGAHWLWSRRHDARRLGLGALVVLGVGVWSNTPVSAPNDGHPFQAEVHQFVALQAVRSGELDRADREVRTALALAPTHAEAWQTRGIVSLSQGRLPEARDAFGRALELEPRYAEAHFNLGTVLERLGDPAEAERHYQAAMQVSPETPRIPRRMGALLARSGRATEAVAYLRRTLELNPGSVEAHALLAWILATHPEPAQRDGRQAVEHALLATQKTPDGAALEALAAGFAESGDFERAVATEEQAILVWRQGGREDIVIRSNERLVRFRSRRPFRDSTLIEARAGSPSVRPD